MGLFDKMKDALSHDKKPAEAPAADAAAADAERAEAEARLQADEQAVAEATERAEAEARLRADEQAIADAEKATAEREAAEKAAAEQAEAQRVADEQAAAQRAEEERRNAEAEAGRRAEEDRRNAEAAAAANNKPGVSVGRVIEVVNHDSDPNTPTGQGMDPQLGQLMEAALRKALADNGLPNANKDDGALGTSFLEAYSVWQGHLGYDGDDANGVPGRASLEKLAEATGMFRVEN